MSSQTDPDLSWCIQKYRLQRERYDVTHMKQFEDLPKKAEERFTGTLEPGVQLPRPTALEPMQGVANMSPLGLRVYPTVVNGYQCLPLSTLRQLTGINVSLSTSTRPRVLSQNRLIWVLALSSVFGYVEDLKSEE
ncbi:hypothetical protein C8F04DRAFT_1188886 [Mycena alexandri]|uniref:Uncharacterized protein n=1 Tax=Mycena alexandri TaxID=1745969 RepID=A0AAD6SHP1_9AGAR|nr:hypothetical protein C8F04DRAFT_1188886 [Mycena alexandri]